MDERLISVERAILLWAGSTSISAEGIQADEMHIFDFARTLASYGGPGSVYLAGSQILQSELIDGVQLLAASDPEAFALATEKTPLVGFFEEVPDSLCKRPEQYWFFFPLRWQLTLARHRLLEMNAVLAQCEAHKANLVLGRVPQDKIDILPAALDARLFHPPTVTRQQHAIVLINDAQCSLDYAYLVETMALVTHRFPDARLTILDIDSAKRTHEGRGPSPDTLAPHVTIEYICQRKELAARFSTSSILWAPAHSSGFPLYALAAQACGCIPVLRIGGAEFSAVESNASSILYAGEKACDLAGATCLALTQLSISSTGRTLAQTFAAEFFPPSHQMTRFGLMLHRILRPGDMRSV